MILQFVLNCTSEGFPSKLALKAHSNENGFNFKKKCLWNGSKCPLRLVASLLHLGLFSLGSIFIHMPPIADQLILHLYDLDSDREKFYLEFLQWFLFLASVCSFSSLFLFHLSLNPIPSLSFVSKDNILEFESENSHLIHPVLHSIGDSFPPACATSTRNTLPSFNNSDIHYFGIIILRIGLRILAII